MRTVFWIGITLSILAVAFSIASLWYFAWLSPGRSMRLSLSQGRLWIWSGQPNDFSAFTPGFDAGGWTGGAIDWTPEIERSGQLFVPTAPTVPGTPPGTPVMAKRITGLSIVVPMWIPLGLAVIPTALLPVAVRLRARRRVARGHCRACGYDLGGVAGACPECGTLLARLLRWVRGRALGARGCRA